MSGAEISARGALGAAGGAAALPPAPVPSAIPPTTAPTGATSPAGIRISESTPLVVDGTSIDTLSVSISNRLSPGFTASPAALNHLVIFPSATVSPSCGIRTSMAGPLLSSSARVDDPVDIGVEMCRRVTASDDSVIIRCPACEGHDNTGSASLDPFPDDFVAGRTGRTQNTPVAGKFIAAHHVALVGRLDAALLVMGDGAGSFVDRVGAEIGDVIGERSLGLVRRWFLAGHRDFAIRRHM